MTALAERFAAADREIARIHAERLDAIGAINARADMAMAASVGERDKARARLSALWLRHGAKFTRRRRRSVQLGGCMIGTRAGRSSLVVDGDESAVVARLATARWAKGLLRVTTSLNRMAVQAALRERHAPKLAALGLSIRDGESAFYVERVRQDGVIE